MGIKDSIMGMITPKTTKVAEEQSLQRELNALNSAKQLAENAVAATERKESTVSPISAPDQAGTTQKDFELKDAVFSNFDFNVGGLTMYSMKNMQKLSSNEIDVYADPRTLFEKTRAMYPADQVTFAPALLTLRDQAATCAGTDILSEFELIHKSSTPLIGLVLRAHCSDLFKGSTKLRVKTNFVDVTASIDDVKNPGVMAVLFGVPRENVNIETEVSEGTVEVSVEYTERDRTCFIDFPTTLQRGDVVVSGDNVWVEVFPIVGTSMLRKVVLADIASHQMELLPAQLMTLI